MSQTMNNREHTPEEPEQTLPCYASKLGSEVPRSSASQQGCIAALHGPADGAAGCSQGGLLHLAPPQLRCVFLAAEPSVRRRHPDGPHAVRQHRLKRQQLAIRVLPIS